MGSEPPRSKVESVYWWSPPGESDGGSDGLCCPFTGWKIPHPDVVVDSYCPSLVKLEAHLDSEIGRLMDAGVVLFSDDTHAVVLGRASLLYEESSGDSKKLCEGKVTVIYKEGSYEGVIVYLDDNLDFVVVNVSVSRRWESADLGTSSTLNVDQDLLAIDLFFGSLGYTQRLCRISDLGETCRPCFHIEWKHKPATPGVYFTLDGKFVGLKQRTCEHNNGLVHVSPIDSIRQTLDQVLIASLKKRQDIHPIIASQSTVPSMGRLQFKTQNERLFRFVFPEGPDGLTKFVETFSPRWKITKINYQAQDDGGANFLVAIQVKTSEMDEFQHHAKSLGCEYADETHNPLYTLSGD